MTLEKIHRLSRSLVRVARTEGPVQAIRETVRYVLFGEGIATIKEFTALRAEHAAQHAALGRQAAAVRWLVEHQPHASNEIADSSRELVSIVMPVWNREAFIGTAIESVQRQAYRNWELLIVDDGSTDATHATVSRYLNDQRIHYIRQDHKGQAAARNRALAESSAGIIAYLDSDDTWYPNHLSEVVRALIANPERDCVYTAQLVSELADGVEWIRDEPFDRDQLRGANFISLISFAHRRHLRERYGDFDESMLRCVDWELIIRYTADSEPIRVSVVTNRYREGNWPRVTTVESASLALYQLSKKAAALSSNGAHHPKLTRASTQLKVLYALELYPALSESYIATEIECMRRRGFQIEAWSAAAVPAPISYNTDVPIHRGSLASAIEKMRPHLVHAHHLHTALKFLPMVKEAGLRMTVRGHGFEFSPERIVALARADTITRVFQFPHLIPPGAGDKVIPMTACFDPELYYPGANKDDGLVVRTGVAKRTKELETFIRVARRCPEHRFVLIPARNIGESDYLDWLIELNRSLGSPAKILPNLPHREARDLIQQAAIYLHTTALADPFGMSVSIAEAMATGCYLIGRCCDAAESYIGDAGRVYSTEDEAVELIRATSRWDEESWRHARLTSVNRAFRNFAGPKVLEPLYREWLSIAALDARKQ